MAKCNGSCDHISEYLIDPIKNNSFDPLLLRGQHNPTIGPVPRTVTLCQLTLVRPEGSGGVA